MADALDSKTNPDVLKTNRLQQHNASWLTELHPTIAVLKVGHS